MLWLAQKQGIMLQTEQVTGSLLQGVSLGKLYYEDEEVIVDANQVSLALRLTPLLWSRIVFKNIHANKAHLILKDPNPFQNIAPLIRFNEEHDITVKLGLYNVDITHMTLQVVPNAPITTLGHVQLDAYTKTKELHIKRLTLTNDLYHVDARGLLEQGGNPEVQITGTWEMLLKEGVPLKGKLQANGSLKHLQLKQWFTSPIDATAMGELYNLDTKPTWHLTAPISALNLQPVHSVFTDWLVDGELTLQGALRETQEFTSQLAITTPQSPDKIKADITAHYDFTDWQLENLQVTYPKNNSMLTLQGHYKPSTTHFSLEAHSENIRWPLSGEPLFISPAADVRLQGTPADYHIESLASLQIQQSSVADWQVDIHHQNNQWHIKQLNANWPSGLLTLAGIFDVDTAKNTAIDWQFDTQKMQNILPGSHGSIRVQGKFQGNIDKPVVNTTIAAENFSIGDYQLDTLQSSIALSWPNQQPWQIKIDAQGLRTPQLSEISSLNFLLDGTASAHKASLTLQQGNKAWQAKLSGILNSDLNWHGTLQSASLQLPHNNKYTLQSPTDIIWSKTQQSIKKPLCLQQGASSLCLAGNQDAKAGWQISLDANQLPLRTLARLLQNSAMGQVSPTGTISFHTTLSKKPQQKLTGDITLRLPPGELTLDDKKVDYQGGYAKAAIVSGNLTGNFNFNLWEKSFLEGQIQLPAIDNISPQRLGTQTINLSINTRLVSPEIIELFTHEVSDLAGPIVGKMHLSRTLGNPLLEANITWQQGAITIPRLGISLDDIYLTAKSDRLGALHIRSVMRAGDGELLLRGKSEVWQNTWQTEITLNGKDATVMDTAQYHLIATPELQLTLLGKAVDIEGKVIIPKASLKPHSEEDSIAPSSDIEIISAQPHTTAPFVSPFTITNNIVLQAGNEVNFEGYKLKAQVKGQIRINRTAGKTPRAIGELTLHNGSYTIYGKKLDIKKGRLLFADNPLFNPTLDIQAERNINITQTPTTQLRLLETPNVPMAEGQVGEQEIIKGVVGIQANGTLDAPQISLYSNPWLPETERLSYLLLGVPSESASGAQGQLLAGAFQELAGNLGWVQEEGLLNGMSKVAGLDSMNVESSTEVNRATGALQPQTSLVLGKNFTEDLSLNYSIGLLDPINIVLLRYRLSNRWSLQTEADNQGQGGGDLIYSFER